MKRLALGLCVCCSALLALVLWAGGQPFAQAATPTAAPPALPDTETDLSKPRMSADDAAASIRLPAGFRATVFAAEPQVQNPIAACWDTRGRLWVAENYTYAERTQRFDLSLKDRIVILEDADGDGQAERRTVFSEDLQMLTSIARGRGGVYVMCPPRLLFIPDANDDGVPDGPAQVLLDGFTVAAENYHNFANGLKWGPDGWLYGRCGASCPAEVGAPGTPAEHRVSVRGGMWRYHTEQKVFESLNTGCTNPWGQDWDRHGEQFFINTVNGHLWHHIPGAHYVRPHTLDPNPHSYVLIDQHADHWHFDTGKGWQADRNGPVNNLGGGHAHVGMVIYQGDNWPAPWRDKLFTVNMHGRQLNVERLERHGSGYVGRHEPDIAQWADFWFRGMDLLTGPDGGVYVLDWSDTGECHDNTGVHRNSGRVYKITHESGQAFGTVHADLSKLDLPALAALHRHANEWQVRTARQMIVEAAIAGRDVSAARTALLAQLNGDRDVVNRLRALWTLWQLGAVDESALLALAKDPDEHVRTWAVRLIADRWPIDGCSGRRPAGESPPPSAAALKLINDLAANDPSGLVRLAVGSTLLRLPPEARVAPAATLAAHAEDAADHNLPSLVWYALIPVARTDAPALAGLAKTTRWPLLRRLIARRLTEDLATAPQPVESLLAAATASAESAGDLLQGMTEALAGWRKAPKPAGWDTLVAAHTNTADAALQTRIRDLSALFGDGRALDELKRLALDGKADMPTREAALRTLIENRPPDLRAFCEKLLEVRYLNGTAARGLAQFDDPAIGRTLAKSYRRFAPDARRAVMDTLVSRKSFAAALLDEVGPGRNQIPPAELTAFHARQIRAFNDPALSQKLTDVWGALRDTPEDKKALVETLRKQLSADALAKANLSNGRAVYQTVCGACHTLYGEGGKIGPDLTGSGRANLDYLLENIADPSAVVAADYRMVSVTLRDDSTLMGVIAAQTDRTLTLRTLTEAVSIDKKEIAEQKPSALSMMPEGLLTPLGESQVRDLIAYLMHPSQVPLPAAGGR